MKVSNYIELFEMARADLEGVVDVIKSGDFDKAASMYISKAKSRGLDAKKITIGLGSTFRTYTDVGPEDVKQLKDKIKEKLGPEMPEKSEKKSSKKKKESSEEEEVEKKKESAEMAKAGKRKPKTELLKAPKGEAESEPPMAEGTNGGRQRLKLVDEILYRSGMLPEGEYMRRIVEAKGSEGDAGKAFKGKGKKGSPRMAGSSGQGRDVGTVADNTSKAARRAENEQDAGEDREGLRGAPGTGEAGGDFERVDDLRHPAKGTSYVLGNKGRQMRPESDPNMGGGGISTSRGRNGPREGDRNNLDNEGLSNAPGLGDGTGIFGIRDPLRQPNKGVRYALGDKKGSARPESDPNMRGYVAPRNNEGGGSAYTLKSGKKVPGALNRPASDPNMRSGKKG